jgi:threonine synthase
LKQAKQPYIGLQCTECHRFFPDEKPLARCPSCHGLLDTVLDESILSNYSKRNIEDNPHSMWKFHMFPPVRSGTIPVTAGEGDTPLRLVGSYPRLRNLWVKDETRNPTGTFKDRGASLAVTRLSQLRVRKLVLASEGNAGCSLALYSQIAGIACHIYLPKDANLAKVELSRKLGAHVSKVQGTISDAGRQAAKLAEKNGRLQCVYLRDSVPTRWQRNKGPRDLPATELAEPRLHRISRRRRSRAGRHGKMFKILQRLGWIRKTPRIIAVQPRGCAPIVNAYNKGTTSVAEWKSSKTIANGLKIPKPLAGNWILKSLRESRGLALKVSDEEIHRAMLDVSKRDGLLIEPSSAAAFAALPKLYESGAIDKKDSVVVIATGSGLKTIEQF